MDASCATKVNDIGLCPTCATWAMMWADSPLVHTPSTPEQNSDDEVEPDWSDVGYSMWGWQDD